MFDTSRANCIGIDPEMFFTEHVYDKNDLYFLNKICNACEIFATCRDYAIRHDVDGFWAGMSKTARQKERKRLGILPITIISEIKEANGKSA